MCPNLAVVVFACFSILLMYPCIHVCSRAIQMLAEGQQSAAVASRQRHRPRQQQPGLTASPGTLHGTPYAMDFRCSGD